MDEDVVLGWRVCRRVWTSIPGCLVFLSWGERTIPRPSRGQTAVGSCVLFSQRSSLGYRHCSKPPRPHGLALSAIAGGFHCARGPPVGPARNVPGPVRRQSRLARPGERWNGSLPNLSSWGSHFTAHRFSRAYRKKDRRRKQRGLLLFYQDMPLVGGVN